VSDFPQGCRIARAEMRGGKECAARARYDGSGEKENLFQ